MIFHAGIGITGLKMQAKKRLPAMALLALVHAFDLRLIRR